MFELIIKDIMEVAGYLPIGILCGCIAVVVYLVYTVSPAGKKVSAGGNRRSKKGKEPSLPPQLFKRIPGEKS